MGGFLVDTPYLLLDREAAVAEVCAGRSTAPIEMMGAGVLRNARPGIWIAGMCSHPMIGIWFNAPGATSTCAQVLDVRHSVLFLEDEYWDGTWEYEDLGKHFMDEEAAIACCAVFNHNSLIVRHTKYWIRKRHDWRPKGCLTPYAAAINTNLHGNGGLLSKFQVMCDMTGDGRIVSIRITQQLF
ncbi:hypothetical protein PR202_gb26664 [Eleusine coracana subsp. coracana]|uniref:Uncharacterized protein n=1 Tax=Eleusine coracana subsp. coracana TaxID=191504 RepID=A0AAV5FS26_ELECO|nr:hypothetical protein PR202_gb26664 [Eleusine coracana subsp. coracana]